MTARQPLAADVAELDPHRSIESARKHYEEVLAIARAAAAQLTDHLRDKGIPPRKPVPGYPDAFDGLAAVRAAAGCRLINTFAWANKRLWLAAQMVCDMEGLDEDGIAEGIVWEVPL